MHLHEAVLIVHHRHGSHSAVGAIGCVSLRACLWSLCTLSGWDACVVSLACI